MCQITVWQNSCCVISILEELCFFFSNYCNSFYLYINFWRTAIARVSTATPYKYGDRGSSCLTHLSRVKWSVVRPLLIQQLWMFLDDILTHEIKTGTNWKPSRQLKRKLHSKLSNASWKSWKSLNLEH